MFVLRRSLMVKEKMERLNNGYNAYAETDELIKLMEREIMKQELPVICEKTDNGCWFTLDSSSSDYSEI